MKKYISILFVLVMTILSLSACGSNTDPQSESQDDSQSNSQSVSQDDPQSEKLQIVTTIFPAYDWVKEILGDNADNVELTLLLDDGVDLHNFQPTTDDIIKVSNADMFIYVGGVSDGWVEDALETATNKDMVVINMLEILGDNVKAEEIVEGMEDSHDHDHEDEDEHDHDEDEDVVEDEHDHDEDVDIVDDEHDHDEDDESHEHDHEDEHVWLSLKNAQIICGYISNELGKIDSESASTYASNTEAYNQKLNQLDLEYQDTVDNGATKTLLFGDRFPFRYLVDDYDLSYYAAFSGCSAETEASFETIVFLADKTDELNLNNVVVIESADQSIARTIIDNTETKDQEILVLDSMQSTTAEDIASGTSYLSIMESNLEVLKKALS